MTPDNLISDYSNGATGTMTTLDGQVNYTVTSPADLQQDFVFDSALPGGNDFSDNFRLFGIQGAVEVSFQDADDPNQDAYIRGLVVQVTATDRWGETVFIINGTAVNLNDLVANGDVIIYATDAGNDPAQFGNSTAFINNDGNLTAAHNHLTPAGAQLIDEVVTIEFLTGVRSIGVDHDRTTGQQAADIFRIGTLPNPDIVCFTADTLIETQAGQVKAADLRVGMMVKTMDNGLQPICWIGKRSLGAGQLEQNPKLRPIVIMADALAPGLPQRDLRVSRQHRMLIASPIVERMFGEAQVLISAIRLTAQPGIHIDGAAKSVTYIHLLFERHEIIYAEGAPSESLYLGPFALETMTPETRDELLELFPEIAKLDGTLESARIIPPGKPQRQLVARHLKNNKPYLVGFVAQIG